MRRRAILEEEAVVPSRAEVRAEESGHGFDPTVTFCREVDEDAVWGDFLDSEIAECDLVFVRTVQWDFAAG